MPVTYPELLGLNPHALTEAAGDLGRAASALRSEYTQYDRNVTRPLKAEHGWSGGGQPDALIVATVNGLAIDTMRMRVAAGDVALTTLAAGLTTAQQQLTARDRAVEADGYQVSNTGQVTTLPAGNPTFTGTGSPVDDVTRHQRRLDTILAFATKVDTTCAKTLRRSDDLPVTGQYASPGLLARARRDNRAAARDLSAAVGLLFDIADAGAELAASGDGGTTLLDALAGMNQTQRDELSLAIITILGGAVIASTGSGLITAGGGLTFGSGGTLAIAGTPVAIAGAATATTGTGLILTGTGLLTKNIHDLYSQVRDGPSSSNYRNAPYSQRPAVAQPRVSDPKLRNILNNLYKGTKQKNWTGDGTTADALRSERASGQATSDRWHRGKAGRELSALQQWLSRNPGASAHDKAVARAEMENLISVLR